MTPEQKLLVQSTFGKVLHISDTAADLFYTRLFELDPSLKVLFKGDLKEQGEKLMTMLGVIVNGLNRVSDLLPVVADLGRRHAKYGVKEKDYDTVGVALLWTLEKGLGDGFTPQTKEAWAMVYGMVASTMKQAAAELQVAHKA